MPRRTAFASNRKYPAMQAQRDGCGFRYSVFSRRFPRPNTALPASPRAERTASPSHSPGKLLSPVLGMGAALWAGTMFT